MLPSASRTAAPFDTDEIEVILTDERTGAERRAVGHLAVVDGSMYLRPRGGRRSAWARALPKVERLAISAEGATLTVSTRPVRDPGVLRRVTEALLARFQYHPAMPRLLDDASIAGTVELVPA